jgi:ATP-dependent Zn protease
MRPGPLGTKKNGLSENIKKTSQTQNKFAIKTNRLETSPEETKKTKQTKIKITTNQKKHRISTVTAIVFCFCSCVFFLSVLFFWFAFAVGF